MKISAHFPAIAVLFLLGAAPAFAQQGSWSSDYAKAVEQARTENKPILLDFTGSDWCGWCMKMKKESLDTPQFAAYAHSNLVLVTVDFPHNTPQTPTVRKQNEGLGMRYKVDGYPCFVLVDKTGRELGRQGGYLAGGAPAFIAKLGTFYKPAPSKAASDGGDDFDKFFHKASASSTP